MGAIKATSLKGCGCQLQKSSSWTDTVPKRMQKFSALKTVNFISWCNMALEKL